MVRGVIKGSPVAQWLRPGCKSEGFGRYAVATTDRMTFDFDPTSAPMPTTTAT